MSTLSTLIGGADCGPVNPLQGLAKRFDSDRGAQNDQFRSARAGPSREVFRSQELQASPALLKEANDFFQGASSSSRPTIAPSPFDLSSLNAALLARPVLQASPASGMLSPQTNTPTSGWAQDFSASRPALQTGHASPGWANEFRQASPAPVVQARENPSPMQQSPMLQRPQFNMAMANIAAMRPAHPLTMVTPSPVTQRPPESTSRQDVSSWADHFSQVDSQLKNAPKEVVASDLAETAGLLVDALKGETSQKFKNSEFLGMMRQVRDKQLVLEGNDLVPTVAAAKGKGVLREDEPDVEATRTRRKSVKFDETAEDDETAQDYWMGFDGGGEVQEAGPSSQAQTRTTNAEQGPNYFARQEAEWASLQNDWNEWEATSTGFKRTSEAAETRAQSVTEHQSAHQSILEKEAAVADNPNDAQAWLDLGVRQQENEHEDKAIEALTRAVELDPTLLPAWLALAISHTNEGRRHLAYHSIRQWILHNDTYSAVSTKWNLQSDDVDNQTLHEARAELVDCLLEMANVMMPEWALDPDVQVALAILLNTSDDFARAQDCFKAALEARPNDWQLYNRVGATLANAGNAEEALPYYHHALELNPGYIRARFNLGISCINLHKYEEAASHILDALILQEAEGLQSKDSAQVTSGALWETLRTTSVHLKRHDLANLCDQKDLSGFRAEFVSWTDA